MTRIAVVGASGFVGRAVVQALEVRGHEVTTIRAPRLDGPCLVASPAAYSVAARESDVDLAASQLTGCESLINCAGDPDASSHDTDALNRANGELVGVLAEAANRAAVARFVHVSSAVVQGRRPVLDATMRFDAFSPYAKSKVMGEELLQVVRPEGSVIYRPPSVHAQGRRVTQMTTWIAASPIASVASPADSPTPQALLENVADAIAFLATCPVTPPAVVIHPWEGLTTSSLLQTLSGKRPRVIPRPLARAATVAAASVGRFVPKVAANARRLEMIWFGQEQGASWLTAQGWAPPIGWDESLLRN